VEYEQRNLTNGTEFSSPKDASSCLASFKVRHLVYRNYLTVVYEGRSVLTAGGWIYAAAAAAAAAVRASNKAATYMQSHLKQTGKNETS
jgi:hypothetical protein